MVDTKGIMQEKVKPPPSHDEKQMKTGTMTERNNAIESGVHNAVDTVVVDKAMATGKAYENLSSFVQDGLSCYGLDDEVSGADLEYAKSCWPLAVR